MKKITKFFFVSLLLIFPPLIKGMITFISNEVNFSILTLKIISLNFFQIIMENLSFYATCFSLIWAIEVYFKQQKDREESIARDNKKFQDEIRRREDENREIKLKELEKYKDSFRPNFLLSQDGKKLTLIMKNSDYYLENVYYYKSGNDKGKQYINLAHKMDIDLNGVSNNYFVTAETLIGEKIIFGVILNNLKVYKLLKEGRSPIIPNDFHNINNNIENKINDNWISFNDININDDSHDSKFIDINFMYKTVAIREKMALNITEHMKEILSIKSVKDIFITVLASLSSNKKEFNDTIRQKVIKELQEVLKENLDNITINPSNIEQNILKYIYSKGSVENNLTDDKSYAALYLIEPHVNTMSSKNIENVISVFLTFMKNANFSEQLEVNIEIYKYRILKCIEN